jgi:hypothetical protein
VIVALHVATGAAVGAATGSRLAALLLGPGLHLAGDRVPHEDIHSRRFEIGSGVAGLLLLAARRGLLDQATLGAAATCAPDLEHVLPFPAPRRTEALPRRRLAPLGVLPCRAQLLLAGGILAGLILARSMFARARAVS